MADEEQRPDSGRTVAGGTHCRACGEPLRLEMVDLGLSPPCQTVVRPGELDGPETFYPLLVRVCERCWLAQIPELVSPGELFTEYAYFSAYSDSWVDQARRYVEMMVARAGLGPDSFVVELASNDGYLLQHFAPYGVPVLGIEPAANVAEAAVARGVPTRVEFFGRRVAEALVAETGRADVVIGNNVLAQVPDLNDFVAGVAVLLAADGTATFEFPHLAHLLERVEYDTIYHEHFSYFSLRSICNVFGAHGLAVVDVEELSSHGGSLRVFAAQAAQRPAIAPAVERVLAAEADAGLHSPIAYARFAERVRASKWALLELLIELRRDGKQVVGYGAPGKGNTLLNYCGIRTDLLELHRRPQPLQAGHVHPGHTDPDPSSGAHRRDAARRDRHPALEPRERDQLAARVHGRVGSEARRPDSARGAVRAGQCSALARGDRRLMLSLAPAERSFRRILAVGAHPDDIEIGCGGTLLQLLRARDDVEVRWVVFTAASEERRLEAEASAAAFLADAAGVEVTIHRFRDAFLGHEGPAVKETFETLKSFEPELVLTHTADDRHQDHRLLWELTWNTFRDEVILEYEIPKFDGDLGRPNAYVTLSAALVDEKIDLLQRHFPSQAGKRWFDPETFRGLMRLRGMESNAPERYAEAFVARKLVVAP